MGDNLAPTTIVRFSDRDGAIQKQQEEARQGRIEGQGFDIFSTAVERENYTAAAVKDFMYSQGWSLFGAVEPVPYPDDFLPDPNYRFDQDEANFGYDPSIMSYADSVEEANQMRLQIDVENAQMQMISDSAAGTWGMAFGGVFQPHVAASLALSPVSVPLAIGTEIALETGSEAFLHSQQLTRTFQESAIQVGLTGVAVGFLGGASTMLTRKGTETEITIDDINAGAYDDVGTAVVGGGVDTAGARRIGDDITAAEDKLVGGKLADVFSIGQVSNLVNSVSSSARAIGQRMANNPLFTKAHAAGKSRGVTAEAFTDAAIGKTVIAVERSVPLQKASGLETDAFEHEVGVAMSNGDRHLNPKVQEAAEMYRAEVVTPIREAAERLGMLESADSLNLKISDIDTQIEEILRTGEAGPGSKKIADAIAAEKATIEAAADKTTAKLQKKVDSLEAKLAAKRLVQADGTKGTAPPSMIKAHDEARSLLTAHKKTITASTKAQRDILAAHKKQGAALKAARKEERELNKRLATGGTSFAESYFPRIYNREKILANWNRLENMISEHFKADPKMVKAYGADQLNEMVQDTMSNMMIGRYQNMTVKGEPSPLRARSLAILDNDLEDFLEKNASQAMLRYTQSMQPHIMFREVFENKSLKDLLDEVDAEYRTMQADETLTAAQRDDLFEAVAEDKGNIKVMYDRLTGQVQRSIQPGSSIEKAMQRGKVLATASMLGEIVLTSIPDMARPISHYGMRSFVKGVAKTTKQFIQGVGSANAIQVKRLGAALQRTVNSRAMQFADTLEPQDKWTQKIQKGWSKWSGFDTYTDVMESVAAHAAMDYVLRAARKVEDAQPLSSSEKKQISRMGLDEEDLLGIWKESVETMGAQEDVLKYMNTMAWKDVGLAKRVEAGIGSDIKRTIIQSGIGDRPAFMDRTTYSWMLQFQTFSMQAQNKIVVAGLQNMNRHTAEGMTAMLALGASVAAIKATARGDDITEWSDTKWVTEAMDRSGMMGALRTPINMALWIMATTGMTEDAPSRYLKREAESVFAPPSLAIPSNIGRGIGSLVEGEGWEAVDYLTRSLPMNQLWGIRNTLLTLGEEALE